MGAEKGVNNGSVSSSRCFRRRVVVVGYRKEKKKENCKFHGSPRRFWGKKNKKKQKKTKKQKTLAQPEEWRCSASGCIYK